jgi:hypothetical protein
VSDGSIVQVSLLELLEVVDLALDGAAKEDGVCAIAGPADDEMGADCFPPNVDIVIPIRLMRCER